MVFQCYISWQGQEIRLTANFGVTGFDGSTQVDKISADSLVQQADKNL